MEDWESGLGLLDSPWDDEIWDDEAVEAWESMHEL